MADDEKVFEVAMTAKQVSEACCDWAKKHGLAPDGHFYVRMTTTCSQDLLSVVLTGYPPRGDGDAK